MASPMPLSARDIIEFRPNTAAVTAAREALEKAHVDHAAAMEAASKPDAGDDARAALVAANDAREAATLALEAAETARAAADPVFMLRVPTGRTKALVQHAINADPDVPRFRDNAELLAVMEAEAADAGLLEDDLAAIAEAKPLVAAGQALPNDLWGRIYDAAQDTETGRAIIADRHLYAELQARHRVARHLVLAGRRSMIPSDRELDAIGMEHLRAINAELARLSDLTEGDAKNSDAP